jgi:translation elongation factor EF-4
MRPIRKIALKLEDVIDRQQFDITIQVCMRNPVSQAMYVRQSQSGNLCETKSMRPIRKIALKLKDVIDRQQFHITIQVGPASGVSSVAAEDAHLRTWSCIQKLRCYGAPIMTRRCIRKLCIQSG